MTWRLFVLVEFFVRKGCYYRKRISFVEVLPRDWKGLWQDQNYSERAHACTPVCGFWLFSFERYNGVLEELPLIIALSNTNLWKDLWISWHPIEFSEEFSPLFSLHPSTGSVSETTDPSSTSFSSYLDTSSIVWALFSGREVEELKQLYSRMPISSIELQEIQNLCMVNTVLIFIFVVMSFPYVHIPGVYSNDATHQLQFIAMGTCTSQLQNHAW